MIHRVFARTFKNISLIVLLFATMTPNSRAATEEQDWSEWFLEEFKTARLPKKADFGARQIWNVDSVMVLHYSNEDQIPSMKKYFVIDPDAGDINTPRLVFGTFELLGQTWNPHTRIVMRQNRMIPVIFDEVYRDTAESDPVVFSRNEQAAVINMDRNGKSTILVRVKGSGENLKIFAIDRQYSEGDLITSTYLFMDTLLYRRGPNGQQWMHPAHEMEFTVPPQPQ